MLKVVINIILVAAIARAGYHSVAIVYGQDKILSFVVAVVFFSVAMQLLSDTIQARK